MRKLIIVFVLFLFSCANQEDTANKKQNSNIKNPWSNPSEKLDPKAIKIGDTFNFGDVTIGESAQAELFFENTGSVSFGLKTVKVDSASKEFQILNLKEIKALKQVAGKTKVTFKVVYTPVDEKEDTLLVSIETDIAEKPIIILRAKARGVRPSCKAADGLVWNGKADGKCICKPGNSLEAGKCVAHCKTAKNPCSEKNKTLCSTKDNQVVCLCNKGFHLTNGKCLSDQTLNSCGHSGTDCSKGKIPSGASPTCLKGSCSFKCNPGYRLKDGKCLPNDQITACGVSASDCTKAAMPTKATGICKNGKCGFICNAGYHLQNSQCLKNTNVLSCGPSGVNCSKNSMPANSSASCDGSVCGWVCLKGFHKNEASGATSCISDDTVSSCGKLRKNCLLLAPKNATASCKNSQCGFDCDNANSYFLDGAKCTKSPAKCTLSGQPNALLAQRSFDQKLKKWSSCTLISCKAGFHIENSRCLSNTRSCSVSGGVAEETWNPVTKKWGPCILNNCGSGFCKIAGKCIKKGSLNPQNPCEECDPAKSQTAYSADDSNGYDDGKFCTKGDSCKNGKPFVEPKCVDSLSCTEDKCDENAKKCSYLLKANHCLIAGKCQVKGKLNPANPCEECDPAKSKTA